MHTHRHKHTHTHTHTHTSCTVSCLLGTHYQEDLMARQGKDLQGHPRAIRVSSHRVELKWVKVMSHVRMKTTCAFYTFYVTNASCMCLSRIINNLLRICVQELHIYMLVQTCCDTLLRHHTFKIIFLPFNQRYLALSVLSIYIICPSVSNSLFLYTVNRVQFILKIIH